jgi:hypothetical protein
VAGRGYVCAGEQCGRAQVDEFITTGVLRRMPALTELPSTSTALMSAIVPTREPDLVGHVLAAALGPPRQRVLRSYPHAPEVYPMVAAEAHARDRLHAGGVIVVPSGISAQPATPRRAWPARSNAHS